ncbi:hypothetical protein H0H92_003034 [Tricholoma furcatifolium]|nr:hypothetical protein H0H92_003034 [Tricholoma furcatifolium]
MSHEDATMAGPDELLVTRRSRRSTAGNRMAAALAEMALETTADSLEDDVDFVNDKEEEDLPVSDFESTDEEAEDADAGDKAVQEEDKRSRKDARSRVERATAAAHARQKVTFNPQDEELTPKLPKQKDLKRRVSLGPVVNAETGEVLPDERSHPKKKRHSERKHTILNTSAAVERFKKSEEKKAAMPKKAKVESKTYTQAELIALALDNEEGNIVDHRDYLKVEEEKRKRARVVRATIEGPLIRWISRGEEVKVVVPPPPAPTYPQARMGYGYAPYGAISSAPYGQSLPYTYPAGLYPSGYASYYPVIPAVTTPVPPAVGTSSSQQPQLLQETSTSPDATKPSTDENQLPQPDLQPAPSATPPPVSSSHPHPPSQPPTALNPPSTSTPSQQESQATPPSSSTHQPATQPVTQSVAPLATQTQPAAQINSYQPLHYNPYIAHLQSGGTPGNPPMPIWAPPPPPAPIERTEKVSKSYVMHELAQDESAPNPPWSDTMAAMFGDEVDWEEVKVFVGKNRPISRPVQACPITGKPARYLDPRTGVPFADLRAYRTLTKLLDHDFAWNQGLGCYVGEVQTASEPSVSG